MSIFNRGGPGAWSREVGAGLLAALLLASPLAAQTIQVVGGNVGVGTATPGEKLEVNGNLKLSSASIPAGVRGLTPTGWGYAPNGYRVLMVGAPSGNETVSIGFDPSANPSGSFTGDGREVLFRNGVTFFTPNSANNNWFGSLTLLDGNVGIGTNSPSYKLQVTGTAFVSGALRFSAFSTGVLSTDASGNVAALSYGENGASTILRTGSNGYLNLDNWIRVSNSGMYNVSGDHAYFDGNQFQTRSLQGIKVAQRDGTARGWLYYDGTDNFGLLNKNGSWAVRTTTNLTEIVSALYTPIIYDSNHTGFYLDPNGTSRLNEVTASQYTSPFAGTDSGLIGDRPYQWGYQEGGPWTFPYPDLVIGYHTGLKLGANYNYGGTRIYADHPSRTTNMLFSVGDGGYDVRVTNNLYIGGQAQAATFRSTSSARWKEKIETMSHALELVGRLRAVTYRWKSGTPLAGQKDIGFTAEEVDAVLPEIVGHDADGRAASIDYSRVSALLVAAVKEVDQKNSTMAVEFQAMRSQLSALQQQSAWPAQVPNYQFALLGAALLAGFLLGHRARTN